MAKKITIIIIVLVVAVIGYWVYQSLSSSPEESTGPEVNNEVNNIGELPQSEQENQAQLLSPKETYLEMRAELNKVDNFNDLEAVFLKYGTADKITEWEEQKQQAEALPESFKDELVTLIKEPAPADIIDIQESIDNDTATLTIQAANNWKGVAVLVLEGDQWKLESDSWEQ